MADITRKITLTQKTERTGDYFLVEYSTDCVNYTQSIDCTNLYLPSVGSVGYCTVDLDTSCIRLTSLGAGCGNSVIEDLDPTPTTTTTTTTTTSTTTTTAAPTTTTTSTTTTAAPTTTTTTLEPTTTTTTSTTTTTAAPTTTTTTLEPTTTTTTAAPLLVSNGSVTCIGDLGTFTSTFSGGSGTYSYTAIADSQANASNAVQGMGGTRYAVTGNTYEWASIANGTYYVAVLDSVGTVSVQNTPVVINCTTTTTTTTSTTTTSTTTTSTTTTTAAPAYCYTLETVQSSQGECFDCPGYFASTTDTVMKIFTACSGSEIFPPFDINVESRYSDNSTSSLFIPSGYTSSIIIATSDVQCVAAPTCGEIASPTFVSASIVPVSGSIVECCV
jgi:hypothetical protein